MEITTTHGGHYGANMMDPGAVNGQYKEAVIAQQINKKIIAITGAKDASDFSGSNVNENLYNILQNMNKHANANSWHISNHLNSAASQQATGVEVFYYDGDNEGYEMARKVSRAISNALGLVDRGPKTAPLYVVNNSIGHTLLIEWAFISNANDVNSLLSNMDKAVNAMLACFDYATSVGEDEEVKIVEKIKIYQGTSSRKNKGLDYRAHVAQQGWLGYVQSGISGTTGLARQVEAIEVYLNGKPLNVEAHVSQEGWLKPAKLGGTVGKNRALQAFRINSDKIRYRAHVAGIGWQNWRSNNQIAGTTGENRAIEAVEIELV